MKETITVMFYNGMKKQMFLHNFKNIIYGGGESNVKNIIHVGENPRTHKEKQRGLDHLIRGQTSLKHAQEMAWSCLLFHQGQSLPFTILVNS